MSFYCSNGNLPHKSVHDRRVIALLSHNSRNFNDTLRATGFHGQAKLFYKKNFPPDEEMKSLQVFMIN